jgi:hypothetical protein
LSSSPGNVIPSFFFSERENCTRNLTQGH